MKELAERLIWEMNSLQVDEGPSETPISRLKRSELGRDDLF
jgi:hypothetical protein